MFLSRSRWRSTSPRPSGCATSRSSRDRRLMVGHLLQYHPAFIALRDLVREGALGRLQYIYSNRLNLGKVRREEDILWSFAPHDLSMILSLVGQEPVEVTATGGYYLHQTIADVTTTHLAFPGGEQAHVFVSWLHPFKEQKLVVIGDRAMAVFDDGQPWSDKLLLYPHRIEWRETMPVPQQRRGRRRSRSRRASRSKLECRHFLECVATGARPRTDGRGGPARAARAGARQRGAEGRRRPPRRRPRSRADLPGRADPPVGLCRRALRDRRRNPHLALRAHPAAHPDRPRLLARPERHGRARRDASATAARSRTTSRSTRA